MLDPNKNYKAELMKLVTEFSKKENWWTSSNVSSEKKSLEWIGDFDPIEESKKLIQEIITPPLSPLSGNTVSDEVA